MTEERDARRTDIVNGVRQIAQETDGLHRDLLAVQDRLQALESRARDAGIPRLEFALRDSYEKSTKAGEAIERTHSKLNEAAMSPDIQ